MDYAKDVESTRSHFEQNGWTVLKRLLPVDVADATLFQFQRDLGGDWTSYKGDYIKTFLTEKRAFECYSYDYPPMATLQYGLTPHIAALVGRNLAPSHAYFRVYRQGDVCNIHSDSADCEYALSLTLGYANDYLWAFTIGEKRFDPDRESPVEAAKRESELRFSNVLLSVGDAVLYNGYHYLHGRASPNPNQWAAHIFFHWVDLGGRHAAHAFDGRRGDLVRRAAFTFPPEDAPEKLNPNRLGKSASRKR